MIKKMEVNSFDFHKTKNLIDLTSNRMICLMVRGTLRLKTYGGQLIFWSNKKNIHLQLLITILLQTYSFYVAH
jgi:hypothetical protein